MGDLSSCESPCRFSPTPGQQLPWSIGNWMFDNFRGFIWQKKFYAHMIVKVWDIPPSLTTDCQGLWRQPSPPGCKTTKLNSRVSWLWITWGSSVGRKRQFLGNNCFPWYSQFVPNDPRHLGNMLIRLTLGLPGRLEAGHRSKAGLAHASLQHSPILTFFPKDMTWAFRFDRDI